MKAVLVTVLLRNAFDFLTYFKQKHSNKIKINKMERSSWRGSIWKRVPATLVLTYENRIHHGLGGSAKLNTPVYVTNN